MFPKTNELKLTYLVAMYRHAKGISNYKKPSILFEYNGLPEKAKEIIPDIDSLIIESKLEYDELKEVFTIGETKISAYEAEDNHSIPEFSKYSKIVIESLDKRMFYPLVQIRKELHKYGLIPFALNIKLTGGGVLYKQVPTRLSDTSSKILLPDNIAQSRANENIFLNMFEENPWKGFVVYSSDNSIKEGITPGLLGFLDMATRDSIAKIDGCEYILGNYTYFRITMNPFEPFENPKRKKTKYEGLLQELGDSCSSFYRVIEIDEQIRENTPKLITAKEWNQMLDKAKDKSSQ